MELLIFIEYRSIIELSCNLIRAAKLVF